MNSEINKENNGKDYEIIVNAEQKVVDEKKQSFEDVVQLAFGDIPSNPCVIHTITYKRGPRQNPEGTIVAGDVVKVKDGMVFNVTATNKS